MIDFQVSASRADEERGELPEWGSGGEEGHGGYQTGDWHPTGSQGGDWGAEGCSGQAGRNSQEEENEASRSGKFW